MSKCPICGGEVSEYWRVCTMCHADFNPVTVANDSEENRNEISNTQPPDTLLEIVNKSLAIYKENFGIIFIAFWLVNILMLIPRLTNFTYNPLLQAIGLLCEFALFPLEMGLLYVYLKVIAGEKTNIKEIFYAFAKLYWRAINVSILTAIIAMTSLGVLTLITFMMIGPRLFTDYLDFYALLLVSILLILSLFFAFAFILIVDGETGSYFAITSSTNYVLHNFWEIVLLLFISIAIGLAGILVFGIGILFTSPLSRIILCTFYLSRRDKFAHSTTTFDRSVYMRPETEA